MDPNYVAFDSRLWDRNWRGRSLYLWLLETVAQDDGWMGINKLSAESAFWDELDYGVSDQVQGEETELWDAFSGPNSLANYIVREVRRSLRLDDD